MSSNILSIPFRKSAQLSLASTIRQYINTKYDQHPDMFKHDLEVIDALRRDAVNVREPHPSGIKKLQAYAGQLVWVGGKFPIDIGAEFSWYPALGYNTERPMVRNNLKYELMNILYNLASLYSQLAINTPRGNTEGLKSAANYFSLAAGVLSHMQKEILPELRMSDPPEDMDHDTLESLTQLLLAQSQECFWQKAVMDGYKDASIAKLAARVSDLYNFAGEAAMKSEAISNDLNVLKAQGLRKIEASREGYDVIYLIAVTTKVGAQDSDRANMAVARVPPQVANPYDYFGDHAEFGPALFSRLVPFSVHVATSIYEERRDRMVSQNIIPELESLTDKIHEILTSLGLPGSLQALEKPLGLPPSLVQHAEEIRQADAIGRVQKGFADIDKLRSGDMAVFEEGKAALASEEEEDQRLRMRYGTDRWVRPESRQDPQGGKLWQHASEIESYFQSSVSSDAVVREKFGAIQDLLAILSGPDRDLMDSVPSSRRVDIPETLKPVIGRLRGAYNDVLRLESRRRKKVESLRENARRDDIKPDILKEAARLERAYPNTALVPAHFEEFFDKRLDKLYEPEVEAIDKEAKDQERLLADVQRINREFESQKRQMGERGNREREVALQKLDNAYFKYKEIINNLEVGRKFYNDLNKIVGQGFRDVIRGWVAQRRMEARALEEEINMPTLSNLNISHQQPPAQSPMPSHQDPSHSYAPPQQPPQPVQSPAQANIQSWGETVQQPKPVQPTPVGAMWTPGMGIKFGQSGGSGQPPAPGTWNPNSGIKFG
ncbi:hypothetical protein FVEG_09799 [Fusarium verticillioides 7600]|uniref:BRO1 domain-containing protein n=1 Tax=Gibberella moniliformis (strain M3125 / FGSC 7600) TaxID=334819 RepID=W7MG35_GIBM7|nr:hypothetical protein FVEG_09799 [Fusarium verticillioides 7600]EWG50643.1 hypothetical protein FVEG_09799 [Fusarium verticillioides 7600]